MSRIGICALFLSAVLVVPAIGSDEPEDCVRLARTWEEAVAEAKLLNVPLVVHSHGFYCGPCWGMHSAVMANKKYREFAAENTVEVISLSRLEEGIAESSPRAATYEGSRRGQPMKFLVQFPGLTPDEVIALSRSKAGTYNDTGAIPVTFLVNPHTEQEITRWRGGTSAKTIMEAALEARKALQAEHGEGFSTKAFAKFLDSEEKAWEKVAKGDYAAALKEAEKALARSADWPEVMKTRGEEMRRGILAAAEERVAAIEAMAAENPNGAKAEMRKILRKLAGTGLEDRAKQFLANA